ncbi:hypothetical protein [Mangrovibacillus cuniculi]|uniref:Uncharacterized protein n=1 Tax=Mangrovibacillus cuniculi TaxID=2593652 RepID=A0A7S8HHB2_9BACI|nr:hypothetical protein [Mangrovibacillus cuniculi]QPC47092.1 hypothetical protein G8O30_08995 [Mangrovibacillus cuniculi]QPC48501.1 hypothetical protein G8O30_15965 [Mangrovibacillus cuniculi]
MNMTINEFMARKHKNPQYRFPTKWNESIKKTAYPVKLLSISPLVFIDPFMFAIGGGFLFIAFVEKGLEIAELEGVAYYLSGFIRILLPLVGIGFFIHFITTLPFIWWVL